MAEPDLSKFAAAVRLRDRCTAAAVANHEWVGLTPSSHYARATYDAIAELVREDERRRLAAAGRASGPCCQAALDSGGNAHAEDCPYLAGVRHGRKQAAEALHILPGSAVWKLVTAEGGEPNAG